MFYYLSSNQTSAQSIHIKRNSTTIYDFYKEKSTKKGFSRTKSFSKALFCACKVLLMCYNIQKAHICAYQEHLGGLTMMEEFLKEYAPVLSVEDVAHILDVSPKTVRGLVKSGDLIAIKVGRLIRIPKDKLIIYLDRHD